MYIYSEICRFISSDDVAYIDQETIGGVLGAGVGAVVSMGTVAIVGGATSMGTQLLADAASSLVMGSNPQLLINQ